MWHLPSTEAGDRKSEMVSQGEASSPSGPLFLSSCAPALRIPRHVPGAWRCRVKRQTRPLITLAFTQPASLDTEGELGGSTANPRTLSGQVGGRGQPQLLERLLTVPRGTSLSRYPSSRCVWGCICELSACLRSAHHSFLLGGLEAEKCLRPSETCASSPASPTPSHSTCCHLSASAPGATVSSLQVKPLHGIQNIQAPAQAFQRDG